MNDSLPRYRRPVVGELGREATLERGVAVAQFGVVAQPIADDEVCGPSGVAVSNDVHVSDPVCGAIFEDEQQVSGVAFVAAEQVAQRL